MLINSLRFFLLFLFISITAVAQEHYNNVIQYSKRGVVSISSELITSVYPLDNVKEISGTGFIVDKKQGLIITNEHLASKARISEYKVSFFNGREAEAKFLYSDPWVDFAILKVNPKDIPIEAVELELSTEAPMNEDNVIIIGNNQGNNYSIQSGIISNIYDSMGAYPYQNIIISLNTRGGSSGSPILNAKGKVIALNYAGDATYAAAIPIAYIKDALEVINQNKTPPRKDIGVMLRYYSLDSAATFSNFPKELIDEYNKKYPEALSKALKVTSVFEDSPAYNQLKPGDIIWKINEIEIGPELYNYQKIINMSSKDSIQIEVYRDGKLKRFTIPLYNLHNMETSKVVRFGGATFIAADNRLRLLTGAKKGEVFITNVTAGSSFDVLPSVYFNNNIFYFINVVSINNRPIQTLDDLIKAIPHLVEAKNLKMHYKNYAYYRGFDSYVYTNRNECDTEIKYNSPDSEPTILSYDKEKLEWISKKILAGEKR